MKTSLTLFLSMLILPHSGMAQQCGNATLRGAYAYAVDVITTVDGKSFTNSDVGRVVFDGAGRFTAKIASTVNGSTSIGEGSGEYLIGADCTMTGKGDGIEFDAVVVNNGSDFMIVIREPGLSRAGNGTKIEGQTCTATSVNGSYGYQGQGSTSADGRVFSLSEVGIFNFNSGRVTGVYSASSGGQVERREISGTFELNADCTGTATYQAAGVSYVMNFVVATAGNTIYYSETGAGTTITGIASRVTPQ
ncbi:MAG: hypothetical protein JNL98_30685 [Bryobacterales bacterium]|nr:hypothetical protein [Bryobacterales bacterium]